MKAKDHDMRRKSDQLLEGIAKASDRLVDLTRKLSPMDALEHEESILAKAADCGIDVVLPDDPESRGEALSRIEQRVRMQDEGLVCSGKNLTLTYTLLGDGQSLTQLVLDYGETDTLQRAYVRSVDRFENRSSIAFKEDVLHRLEETFGIRGAYFDRPVDDEDESPGQRQS